MIGARLRRAMDSQDLVQATLASVLGELETAEFRDAAHRRGYLRRAMHNRARALGRDADRPRQSNVNLDAQAGREPPPSAAAREDEQGRVLNELLAGLREADIEVLRLVHVERRSYEQVAEALGVRTATARKRYSRAIARLRELAGEGPRS